LRGSGGLEQAADIVIAIRPPDKEVTDSEAARYPLTLSILKQRNGRMGNFRLLYTPALTKFSDMQG
jgi:replicative DNA helicase